MMNQIAIKTIDIKLHTNNTTQNKNINIIYDESIKIHINDYLYISFITINYDLTSLTIGYLLNIGIKRNDIDSIEIKNNDVFVKISISKKYFLSLINKKDIAQTCESIHLYKNTVKNEKIIIPFNSSRVKLKTNEIHKYCNDINASESIFKAKLINNNQKEALYAYDINMKNAIYRVFGKNSLNDNFLEYILILNSNIDMDILREILLFKITFLIIKEQPSFSIIKNAQKYGLTLIEYVNSNKLKVYTHTSRIS